MSKSAKYTKCSTASKSISVKDKKEKALTCVTLN